MSGMGVSIVNIRTNAASERRHVMAMSENAAATVNTLVMSDASGNRYEIVGSMARTLPLMF